MFSTRQLVPGRTVRNCVEVVNGAEADGLEVRLSASDLAGPLVAGLRICVEPAPVEEPIAVALSRGISSERAGRSFSGSNAGG
jgi:hypothetical protein